MPRPSLASCINRAQDRFDSYLTPDASGRFGVEFCAGDKTNRCRRCAPVQGIKTMKSVANGYPANLLLPLFGAFLPAGVLAGEAHSSMEVSVEVVRGYDPAAAAALTNKIDRLAIAQTRSSAAPTINSAAECKAIGTMPMANAVSASCSWEPDTQMYLVTIQY